jgi:hypothetical protein
MSAGSRIPRRRFGPILAVLADLFRDAWVHRAWAVLAVAALTLVAAVLGSVGQAAAPFLVYGGL